MMTYFAPIARLLGDLIVSLPPLQSLIESSKEDVYLILRSPAQEGLESRIPGLSGTIKESDFLKLSKPDRSIVYNLRDHPLQTGYVWGSPEFETAFPGYRISDVIRDICRDLKIEDGQTRLKALSFVSRPEVQGKIILIPGSSGPIKEWCSAKWLELQLQLKNSGFESLMIGEPRVNRQVAELLKSGMPWLPTPFISDALDLISSARAVVSVDTGLMHLAVHQGVKTVGLFRDYTMFLRDYPHTGILQAPACDPLCRQSEFAFCPNNTVFYTDWSRDSIFDYWNSLKCRSSESKCMARISVDSVLNELDKLGVFS